MLETIKKFLSKFEQKTIITVALIAAVLVTLLLIVTPAKAQFAPYSYNSGGCGITANESYLQFSTLGSSPIFVGDCFVSYGDGLMKSAISAHQSINFNGHYSNGSAGFFSVRGVGSSGPGGAELTAVNSRVQIDGPYWGASLHGECRTYYSGFGGLCIGMSVEMQSFNNNVTYIGANIQAQENTRNVIGLQLQGTNTNYKYAISAPNLIYHVGQIDDVAFCLKFEPSTQRLEFWRGCYGDNPTRHGFVNMNWGSPDVQLNR